MRKDTWISLWMIAFAAMGIASLLRTEAVGVYLRHISTASYVITPAMLVLIGLLGLLNMHPSPVPRRRLGLKRAAGTYMDALRILTRHRWLIWLLGSVLAFDVLCLAADHLIDSLFFGSFMSSPFEGPGLGSYTVAFSDTLLGALHNALAEPTWIVGAFAPGLAFSQTDGALAIASLVVVVTLVCAGRWLRRLAAEAEYESPVSLIRLVSWPLVISTIGATTYDLHWRALMSQRGSSMPGFGAVETLSNVVRYAFFAAIAGFLVGGFGGSLRRVKEGKNVSTDSFFRNSVRYFGPVTCAYLLIEFLSFLVVTLVFDLPAQVTWSNGADAATTIFMVYRVLLLVLMLVPFAAIIHGSGAQEGIRRGMGDWFAQAWHAVVFIAFGFTILTVTDMVMDALPHAAHHADSWIAITAAMPRVLVSIVTAAFISVAIWEYYWRIAGGQDAEAVKSET